MLNINVHHVHVMNVCIFSGVLHDMHAMCSARINGISRPAYLSIHPFAPQFVNRVLKRMFSIVVVALSKYFIIAPFFEPLRAVRVPVSILRVMAFDLVISELKYRERKNAINIWIAWERAKWSEKRSYRENCGMQAYQQMLHIFAHVAF